MYTSRLFVLYVLQQYTAFFQLNELFMLFAHPVQSSLKLGFFYPPPKHAKEQFTAV